jgi:hypothetical protein
MKNKARNAVLIIAQRLQSDNSPGVFSLLSFSSPFHPTTKSVAVWCARQSTKPIAAHTTPQREKDTESTSAAD